LEREGERERGRERGREREISSDDRMTERKRLREGEGKEAADCEWKLVYILGVSRCRWSSCNL